MTQHFEDKTNGVGIDGFVFHQPNGDLVVYRQGQRVTLEGGTPEWQRVRKYLDRLRRP